jgi:hypothetical protein
MIEQTPNPSFDDKDQEHPDISRLGGFPLIRVLVALGRYMLTSKSMAQYEDGVFELDDLECAVCNGRLYKTEKDEKKDESERGTRRKKYTICGPDTRGDEFYCVGKITKAADGRVFVVITAKQSRKNYV